jgi:hypothetical protein
MQLSMLLRRDILMMPETPDSLGIIADHYLNRVGPQLADLPALSTAESDPRRATMIESTG